MDAEGTRPKGGSHDPNITGMGSGSHAIATLPKGARTSTRHSRRRAPVKLELFRCDRCGETIYGLPHHVQAGDICNAPIPAEYVGPWWARMLIRTCPGTFVKMGMLS